MYDLRQKGLSNKFRFRFRNTSGNKFRFRTFEEKNPGEEGKNQSEMRDSETERRASDVVRISKAGEFDALAILFGERTSLTLIALLPYASLSLSQACHALMAIGHLRAYIGHGLLTAQESLPSLVHKTCLLPDEPIVIWLGKDGELWEK